ncbi:MAG: hypothetical protein Q9M28_11995 [Mariprofundaceae bacterium]|nr:hypothetical protein [Mariprofundaceae bacterium]
MLVGVGILSRQLEMILLLMIVGISAYLLFSDDTEVQEKGMKEPAYVAKKSEPLAQPLALVDSVSRFKSDIAFVEAPVLVSPDKVPLKAVNSDVPESAFLATTTIPKSLIIKELKVLPSSTIRCNLGMKVPLVVINMDQDSVLLFFS